MAEETTTTEATTPEATPVYEWVPNPGKRPQVHVKAAPMVPAPHPFEYKTPSEY